jgi:hypothetical protein
MAAYEYRHGTAEWRIELKCPKAFHEVIIARGAPVKTFSSCHFCSGPC